MPGGAQDIGAGRSEPHAATRPLEHRNAQTVFHLANAAAERRLLDAKRVSRAAKGCGDDRRRQRNADASIQVAPTAIRSPSYRFHDQFSRRLADRVNKVPVKTSKRMCCICGFFWMIPT
jgi:hypothetical protein